MALIKHKPEEEARPGQVKDKSLVREYGEALVIALVLALVIRAFVIQAFSIPSGSMVPTLLIGDYLLVNKFVYGIRNPFTNRVWIPLRTPQRGDIVVFIYPQDPSKDYIKRVAGLPGDRIQIVNKKVYINEKLWEIPQAVNNDPLTIPPNKHHQEAARRDNLGPVVVPEDSYFVLGDNRDYSYDSRFWGFVSMDALRGQAFIIYFSWTSDQSRSLPAALVAGLKGLLYQSSWDSKSFQVRWNRIGKLIH